MILLLLYRFCESQDSIIGYTLCKKLAKEGHNVLVTSTSKVKERQVEKETAKRMIESWKGSIQIIEPESEELEEPTPEWIAKLHRTYFPQLELLQGVHTIIGILPGTSQTAMELKKTLHCRLVLLATTKVTLEKDVKKEVIKLWSCADEVWSMGSDIYSHYNDIFSEQSKHPSREVPHRKIMLKPEINNGPETVDTKSQKPIDSNRIATIWNQEYPYYFKGKEKCAMGSNMDNFSLLCSALQKINKERNINIQLDINGLKGRDGVVKHILKPTDQNISINPLPDVQFLHDLTWKHCLAFIVPDIEDDRFNFLALTAMCLGVPTFVLKESTIGKFIQSLDTPLKMKPLVTLTGKEEEEWIKKIKQDLLNEKESPWQWAKELSKYLRDNRDNLWTLDLSVLTRSYIPVVRQDSYNGQGQNPIPSQSRQSSETGTTQEKSTSRIPESPKVPKENTSKPNLSISFSVCSQHTRFRQSLYCEEPCGHPICALCKVQEHRHHNVVHLADKTTEIRGRLEDILKESKTDLNAISERRKELIKGQEDIEMSTQTAIEQMRQQLNDFTAKLASVYSKQVTILKEVKRKQLARLNDETNRLRKLGEKEKTFSDQVQAILDQPLTEGFVNQAKGVLQKPTERRDFQIDSHRWWGTRVYERPEPYSEDFLDYVENHILGHFKVESTDDKQAEIGTKNEKHPDKDTSTDHTESVTYSSSSYLTSVTDQTVSSTRRPEKARKPTIDSSTSYSKEGISPRFQLNVKAPGTTNLKKIYDVQYSTDAAWMCGWNKTMLGKNYTLLAKVDRTVVLKKRRSDPLASTPTVMTCFGNELLFGHKEGHQIFGFDTSLHAFTLKYRDDGLSLASMCSNEENIYLLDNRSPEYISVLDAAFHPSQKIRTGLKDTVSCELDLCLGLNLEEEEPNDRVIIISRSAPHGYVSAINQKGETLWRVHDHSFDEEPRKIFDPCSVGSCQNGTIYVADRTRNKIYSISCDGKDLTALLGEDDGIRKPTRVSVNKRGTRLAIIHNDGYQLRDYRLN